LDPILSQDIAQRMMSCLVALLPCLLLLIGTGVLLCEYQCQVETHGPGDLLPEASIGHGDYTALLTYLLGPYFEIPAGSSHGVHAAWSSVYLTFQQYSFYTTSSSLVLTVLSGHDWVPWGERFGLSETCARCLLLNPPLMMQGRNVFVCFALVLLRPFPVLHAWGWWVCYVMLASWVQVGLHLVQTFVVLSLWTMLVREELNAIKAHIRTLWQLHNLNLHLNGEDAARSESAASAEASVAGTEANVGGRD
jgi:hypothetical protein